MLAAILFIYFEVKQLHALWLLSTKQQLCNYNKRVDDFAWIISHQMQERLDSLRSCILQESPVIGFQIGVLWMSQMHLQR